MAERKRVSLIKAAPVNEAPTHQNARRLRHESSGGAAGVVVPNLLQHYDELKAQVFIDKENLDDAVVRQPQLFFNISEAHALAISVRDQYKERLAIHDSGLGRDVRARLIATGGKFSEAQINDEVILDPSRAPHSEAYNTAARAATMWGILKDSFEQRAKMLRELVSLHATGYFTRLSMGGSNNSAVGNVATSAIRARQEEFRRGR